MQKIIATIEDLCFFNIFKSVLQEGSIINMKKAYDFKNAKNGSPGELR